MDFVKFQDAFNALDHGMYLSAYSHFKTAKDKSREAFESFKSKEVRSKDFIHILSCAKLLATSYFFFYSFNEEKRTFTPLFLMSKSTLDCISRAFQNIVDDMLEIKER